MTDEWCAKFLTGDCKVKHRGIHTYDGAECLDCHLDLGHSSTAEGYWDHCCCPLDKEEKKEKKISRAKARRLRHMKLSILSN